MAVVNKFVDADVEADKKGNPAIVVGGNLKTLRITFEVAAADSNGSVFKLARLPASAIPVSAKIVNDAMTASTDWDLGLYEQNGVDEADKDIFMDGEDIAAGNTLASPVDGMKTGPAIADWGKKIWELLGKTLNNKREGYVLALTANVVGTAAGTVSVEFSYLNG